MLFWNLIAEYRQNGIEMKMTLKNKIVLVLCLVLSLTVFLCACDDDGEENTPQYTDYTVTVENTDGETVSGVVVTIHSADGGNVGRNVTDKTGSVTFTELLAADYTVSVESTSPKISYYYDPEAARLSSSATSLTVTVYTSLSNPEEGIFGNIPNGTLAYYFVPGSYHARVDEGMTYFVVELSKKGVYRVSSSSSADVTVGNYGNPYYVMQNDISTDNESGKSFTIKCEGDRVLFVAGVSSDVAADVIISVEYVSELPKDPIYEPWTHVQAENLPEVSVLPDNSYLSSLDITDPTLTVTLGEDGYYHLGTADGPIVYMRVTTSSKYIDAFTAICEKTNFGWYKYEGETFIKKESFNELILAYGAVSDSRLGVCPLTEELAYAIRSFGGYNKWWDFSSDRHIFQTDSFNVVKENAWLFAAGTLEIDTSAGTLNEATNMLSLRETGKFVIQSGGALYFNSPEAADVTVTINDAEGKLTVTYNGTEYRAENGKISFTMTGTAKSFAVTSSADEPLTCSYTSLVAE